MAPLSKKSPDVGPAMKPTTLAEKSSLSWVLIYVVVVVVYLSKPKPMLEVAVLL